MTIEKITFLLESLFIFWIIMSKRSMNIILLTLSSKNYMYCHVWCLNVNVKNFKFNLHYFNSAQIWLRSYLNLTQTFCLNLTQMWLKCILVSLCIITLNYVSFFSYLNLTQILFKSNLNISFKFDSDVTQMYFNFAVHYHIKMHLISSCSSDILLRSDSNVTQIYFSFICASSH